MNAPEKAGESKARAAVALMFFAGLRPGEARGFGNLFGTPTRLPPKRKVASSLYLSLSRLAQSSPKCGQQTRIRLPGRFCADRPESRSISITSQTEL